MSDEGRQSAPRRGRPRRDEVASIDRGVLDAARHCFVADGFDGTTMEAIAARAGVTKTTLYLRYADKGAVLKAVLEDRMKVWSEVSRQTDWMMGDTIEQRLRYFAQVLLRHARDPEVAAFVKIVNGSFGWAQSIGQEYREMLWKPMVQIISSELRRGSEISGCTARDAELAAASFIGMLSSHAFAHKADNASADDEVAAVADHVTDIFLRGRDGW